jgi:hypothetical protein
MLQLAVDWLPTILGGGGGIAALAALGLRIFTGGSVKVYLYVALGLAVAGAIAYHFILSGNLRVDAANLRTELSQAKASNASLEAANKALQETGRQILTELANLRAADAAAQSKVSEAINRANDAERRAKLERLRNGEGVERLLGTINKSLACEMQNFGKDGECRFGVFIPKAKP